MRTLILSILIFIGIQSNAQEQVEIEIGGGAYGLYAINLWGEEDPEGIQVQFDYDFINGLFRASLGLNAIALPDNIILQPNIKIGLDAINITVSKMPYYLTFYGLSGRAGFGTSKRHGIIYSVQVSEEGSFVYPHVAACLGYSYRF
jgi:hypothetical protein